MLNKLGWLPEFFDEKGIMNGSVGKNLPGGNLLVFCLHKSRFRKKQNDGAAKPQRITAVFVATTFWNGVLRMTIEV